MLGDRSGIPHTYSYPPKSVPFQREGQKVYNTAFTDAIKSSAVVRAKMDDVLKEQGIWDDSKEEELTELQNEIIKAERVLAKGGISLQRAKNIALEMKKTRDKLI